MKKLVVLLFILVLSAAFPALTQAQSQDFPNKTTAGVCGGVAYNVPSVVSGTLRSKIKFSSINNIIDSGALTPASCAVGPTVAINQANALCAAADAIPGIVCGCAFGSPAACTSPCTMNNSGLAILSCGTGAMGTSPGFALTHAAGSISFNIAGILAADALKTSTISNTGIGNEIATDPQPFWLFEANPPPPAGIMTFKVTHACGGTNPRSFTVDTTGKDTLAIATAIANGFGGLGLAPPCSLSATVHAHDELSKYTTDPSEFHCQYFVKVAGADTVQEISATGLPGQVIVAQGNDGNGGVGASVPALGPWGMAALVTVLLLTSLWFLRRRTRTA
jgi:hypothetical protein